MAVDGLDAGAVDLAKPDSSKALLEVDGLSVTFPSEAGPVEAVRGLSYSLAPGEVLGIVGESGSGKSVSSMARDGSAARARPASRARSASAARS